MSPINSKLPSSLIKNNPWQTKSDAVWPATSFNLKRNIAQFNFPSRLGKEEMNRLLPLLANAHLKVLGKETCAFFPAEELSLLDKEFLFEHFLNEESFQNATKGQGLVVGLDGHFLALLNVRDHINLQWVDYQDAWENTWTLLAKIEKGIGNELPYAFSSKFGYLTSNLENCGTGLTICAYLLIPGLNYTKELRPLLHNIEEVKAVGMEGNLDHLLGDLLLLKNSYTLGVSEEGILRSVHLAATKIVGAERAVRAKMIQENNAEVKDLISRAYGLLLHSYQLDTRETLTSLSMIKLAVDLGWIEGLTDEEINAIFVQVRRAHLLQMHEENEQDRQAIQRKRAAFIHTRLKNVHLKDVLL